MTASLTIDDLKKTKSALARHKDWQSLAIEIFPEHQKSFLDDMADILIQMEAQEDVIDLVIDLAFSFIRFGYDDDIRHKAFNLLGLLRDLPMIQTDKKRAQKTFVILKNLAQGTGTSSPEISQRAAGDLLGWLTFPDWDIAKLATLFFLDVKANSTLNILDFDTHSLITRDTLETMCGNIKSLISEGPRTYPSLLEAVPGLTSDQIIQRFLNQFINGPLRTDGMDPLGKSHAFVWEMVLDFIASPPGATEDYKKAVLQNFSKALMSLAEQYEKALRKRLTAQDSLEPEKILVQIDEFTAALKTIPIDKLKKPIQKHCDALAQLQEQVFEAAG